MHEHDQELIMALAEGTLDETAAVAASADISGCPDCMRDLELQRLALSVLADLPDVYLTAAESAQLHTNLRRQLATEKIASPAKPRRTFAWGGRWLPAAGIAAVFLVAIVSLASLSGGSDDDSADMTTAAGATRNAASETTAASAEAALPPRDGSDSNLAADQPAFEEYAGGMTETTAAAETTAAPETIQTAETTTTAAPVTDVRELPPLGDVGDLTRAGLMAELVKDEVLDLSGWVLSDNPVIAGCVEFVTDDNASPFVLPEGSSPVVLGIVIDDTGEELLLVAYVPEDIENTIFVTQRLATCEVVTALF